MNRVVSSSRVVNSSQVVIKLILDPLVVVLTQTQQCGDMIKFMDTPHILFVYLLPAVTTTATISVDNITVAVV